MIVKINLQCVIINHFSAWSLYTEDPQASQLFIQRTKSRARILNAVSGGKSRTKHYAKQQCSAIILRQESPCNFPENNCQIVFLFPLAALAIFPTKMCQIWERCVRECFVNMTRAALPALHASFLLPSAPHSHSKQRHQQQPMSSSGR